MIIAFILIFSTLCWAQTGRDNMLSLDLSYALTGLLHQGGGIGLNYEKKIIDWLSVKGNVGHMTFLTGIDDVYSTSVNLSLFLFYYPFSNGLDKFYAGMGNGCDFMNYFGSGKLPPTTKDSLIYITPRIGWKFNVLKYLMIDVSSGYKYIVSDSQNYKDIKNYLNTGFQFGVSFLMLFKEMRKENKNEQNV